MDYQDKIILAPMVRVSTLPVRLMSLEYGADIVFTEELIDWKLLASVRRWNEKLGTVDYVDPADGTVTFRTCAEERSRVVLQMGTCDVDRALQVAQKYEGDIAGIDINMGCPKEFSIKGGMGAALLLQPEKVKNILTALVGGVNIPVTCKIRLLSSDAETLAFCRLVERCGVSALTVHGRTRTERPRHPVNSDAVRHVASHLSIPVIANGGSRLISCRADAEQFRQRCGAASVMLARAAMWNASVFRRDGPLAMDDVITRLLQLCVRYDHPFTQTKYTVQQMLRDLQQSPRGQRFLAAQTLEEICDLWGLGGTCRAVLGQPASPDSRPLSKRPRLDSDVVPGLRPFVRGHYRPEQLPKTLLHAWCSRRDEPVPGYQLQFSDKLFRAVCVVGDNKYASLWEKNKKFAEQGAALTCVACLGIAASPPAAVSAQPETSPVARTQPEVCDAVQVQREVCRNGEARPDACRAAQGGTETCRVVQTQREACADVQARRDVLAAVQNTADGRSAAEAPVQGETCSRAETADRTETRPGATDTAPAVVASGDAVSKCDHRPPDRGRLAAV